MLMRMELERYRLVYVKCMYMNEEALAVGKSLHDTEINCIYLHSLRLRLPPRPQQVLL